MCMLLFMCLSVSWCVGVVLVFAERWLHSLVGDSCEVGRPKEDLGLFCEDLRTELISILGST